MKKSNQSKLFQESDVKGNASTHELLEIPFLRVIIEDFMPSLVLDPIKNRQVLDEVYSFLFDKSSTKASSDQLKLSLEEEFFTILIGLKTFLIKHNLRVVELSLQTCKEQYKAFLNQELEA